MGAKVLIIDDEVEFSTTLAERLTLRDYEAVAITSLDNVRKLVCDEQPDVVLLDLRMPGVDGLELLKDIRKNDPSTQIIVITGQTDPKFVSEALNAGAYDYLTKPADIVLLMRKIDEITAAPESR